MKLTQAGRTVLPMATACQGGCCGGNAPAPTSWARLREGARYAVHDIWGDLAGWFFVGLAVAAAITVFVPDDLISRHLGGGMTAMLLMLVAGIPMYICATASTPIAAALILKGVSPGAALVFLLAGPATNITALAVIVRILGKGGAAVYLAAIAVVSVVCGLVVDGLYLALGLSAAATLGEVAETLPEWLLLAAGHDGPRDVLDQLRRDAKAGFVQQQQARPGHQRAADHHHLLFAPRQGAGLLADAFAQARKPL